ncbi:MAG: T9SS type A sorting domain-containing protein [Ignavibacteria bacterium]|nr:T9SS type A sorting domain-containing protein [Ignavibacteria bacterium]
MVKGEWLEVGFIEGAGNSNSPKEYSFTDNLTLTSYSYSFRLKQIDIDGKFTYSKEITVEAASQPTEFALKQNYPNPFNPTTKIEFSIPAENNVEIKVYNILGMEVATLLNEHKQAGTHNVEFNANALSSGIYFYKISSGNFSAIKKMTLLR